MIFLSFYLSSVLYYQAEKRANPAKIHYFFSASKELSGKFMITYMPRDKVLTYIFCEIWL